MTRYTVRFFNSDERIPVPHGLSEESAALWAMRLHGGRIGRGVRRCKQSPVYTPRARVRAANGVIVEVVS